MSIPVLTFFNNKGGVGKTSLAYHLAWKMSEMGETVLICDLDPQANLTSAFLSEEKLEELWSREPSDDKLGTTIFKCVEPLTSVGDLLKPEVQEISPTLSLIPGDLALSGFEDMLSAEWPNALGSDNLIRPFRILTAFWTIMQKGAEQMNASIIIADVGPNLGASNRSALIASNFVVVPLAADLFSLQGLRNLGPTLRDWRKDWHKRRSNWDSPPFALPGGEMKPVGYIVQQHGIRLSRPVRAYEKWLDRIPRAYAESLGDVEPGTSFPSSFPSSDQDPNCLETIKHYRSLVPMAQEARKPIFQLTSADGAIGSHASAAQDAGREFEILAGKILARMGMGWSTPF